jgi:TrmH family RNA methyltransferase
MRKAPLLAPHLVVKEVSSPTNHLLKQIKLLHERKEREKTQLFLLDGPKVLNEAIIKRVEIVDIAVSESFLANGLPNLDQSLVKYLYVMPDKLFNGVGTTVTSSGIMGIARMRRKEFSIADCVVGENPVVMVCDAIQDPGNLGTMMRSALAFAASGIILSKGNVDQYNPKVVRGAMGASFALPIVNDLTMPEIIEQLHELNVATILLDANASQSITQVDLKRPVAVFFGNEGHGFSEETMNSIQHQIAIPMKQMSESLNVATSASIVLYECARVRGL